MKRLTFLRRNLLLPVLAALATLCLPLSSCGGGGGGGKDGVSAETPYGYLPGEFFLPAGYREAILTITTSDMELVLVCMGENPQTTPSSGGLLDENRSILRIGTGGKTYHLKAEWRQTSPLNRPNIAGAILLDSVSTIESGGPTLMVDNLCIDILGRVDDPEVADERIELTGKVRTGTVRIDEKPVSFDGEHSATLTYVLATPPQP